VFRTIITKVCTSLEYSDLVITTVYIDNERAFPALYLGGLFNFDVMSRHTCHKSALDEARRWIVVQDVIFPAIKITCKRLYNESFSAAALNFKARRYRDILASYINNLNLLC